MNVSETLELKDIDPDDISDVIVKIEKSFGLALKTDTFQNARTFGELCDISLLLFLCLISSLAELLFNWKYGLLCLGTIIIGYQLASWLGKEFSVKTVGEAATMSARENYIISRRDPKTVNRQEIVTKIKELFSHDLDLDPRVLTRDTPLF